MLKIHLPVKLINITIYVCFVLNLPASKLAENGFRVTLTNYNKENVSQIAILVAVQKDSYFFNLLFLFVLIVHRNTERDI